VLVISAGQGLIRGVAIPCRKNRKIISNHCKIDKEYRPECQTLQRGSLLLKDQFTLCQGSSKETYLLHRIGRIVWNGHYRKVYEQGIRRVE